ncbi:thioredoxin family protein [Campylobacter jejuni]|uniref:thioredoxin family protein n=1 Tax=Campylobacter coli TaxID=195 RepID=UPI00128790A4|nr:thioredoxin family protein [Campylobacter coli]EAH4710059.1 thioredoxin family protein [Campylobacter jejuni]EAH4718917.1 thioredoxin family protein [Campylobacter jejuni]EAH6656513.1 thioredoxin family protein [Campylobacter jejuni]EAI5969165.1 thioredoxin family protein [Campylobacter jejuni]EAI8714230.1 thioredoxin family protein [Campylobacter jejuni]
MIKKIRILFLAIFLAFSPMVLEAKIYDDVYVAQKQALKEAKLMIFFVVSNTCEYCHKLMNDVLNNRDLMEYLNKNFIVAISDLNANGLIPKDLLFNGVTPTTYILTPTGKVIGTPIEGAVDSGILFGLLKGLEDYKKGQLGF